VIHNEMCNFHLRLNEDDVIALFAEDQPTTQ